MKVFPVRVLALAAAVIAFAPFPVAAAANPLLDDHGNPAGFRTLAIGDAAPDFALPGIDGRTYRLADFAGPDVLMVLFTSNHCPTSHGIEQRLKKLREDFRHRSFTLVAINPNHPDGLSADELGYGEFSDSFAEMKPYAAKNGWDFPYIYDGDKQLTARAYGCLATPHVFIFDQQRKLQYAGRFDDSRFPQEETVKSPDARNAIDALLAGKPVPVPLTRPHGCSTKWREKHTTHVALETGWTKIPVKLDTIDAAGLAALRANPTNKFRLFNVWATWCAPCVEEFPSLVGISRKFDMRDFELITLSMDEPKLEAKAQAFLQKQGAGLTKGKQDSVTKEGRKTNHYLFTGANQDAAMAALDPQWPGPIPHTVLVAPGGEIVWRQNGMIDPAVAIAKIVEAMTPYYQPVAAKAK
ncbi:MAG TPA: redoxin domain-containing protein [Opitutaceae bacterium]|nr:redoxin domain-containing protein [Opitutaceae bacterium]